MERFGRHPWLLQVLTGSYVRRGDRRRAEVVHAELAARAISSRVPFFSLAVSKMYPGRSDEAVNSAIRSHETRDAVGPICVRCPDLAPIMTPPRFAATQERMRG